MIDLAERIATVRERIRLAAERTGRSPESIRLVAVSKRHPADAVKEAYREFDQSGKDLGVSELLPLQENSHTASFCFRDPGTNCWEVVSLN